MADASKMSLSPVFNVPVKGTFYKGQTDSDVSEVT